MKYVMEAIEKIISHGNWKDRTKYNKLLELDAINYANLGTDSTKKEREEVNKASRKIYREIKDLNAIIQEDENEITTDKIGQSFLIAMDK